MQPKKFEINSPMILKTKSGVVETGGGGIGKGSSINHMSNVKNGGYLAVQKS